MYEVDLFRIQELATGIQDKKVLKGQEQPKAKGMRRATTYPKASGSKDYAGRRGVHRGGHDGTQDEVFERSDIPLDPHALDEGLCSLVQSGTCRRTVLMRIYKNKNLCKFSKNLETD